MHSLFGNRDAAGASVDHTGIPGASDPLPRGRFSGGQTTLPFDVGIISVVIPRRSCIYPYDLAQIKPRASRVSHSLVIKMRRNKYLFYIFKRDIFTDLKLRVHPGSLHGSCPGYNALTRHRIRHIFPKIVVLRQSKLEFRLRKFLAVIQFRFTEKVNEHPAVYPAVPALKPFFHNNGDLSVFRTQTITEVKAPVRPAGNTSPGRKTS